MPATTANSFPVVIDNPGNVDLESSEIKQFREADRRSFYPGFGAQVIAHSLNQIVDDAEIDKIRLSDYSTGYVESSEGNFAVEFLMGDSLVDQTAIEMIADIHNGGVVFFSKAPLTEEAADYVDSHKNLIHCTI